MRKCPRELLGGTTSSVAAVTIHSRMSTIRFQFFLAHVVELISSTQTAGAAA